MKISEVLPVLINAQNLRVILNTKDGAQTVYQGTKSGISKQTFTDCEIIHIEPESVYSLPHGVPSILNIFIAADKFKKRESE